LSTRGLGSSPTNTKKQATVIEPRVWNKMSGAIRRIKRLGLAPTDGLRIFGGAPVFRSLIEPSFVDPFATAMTNLTFSLGLRGRQAQLPPAAQVAISPAKAIGWATDYFPRAWWTIFKLA
jgi:hypothetical protein